MKRSNLIICSILIIVFLIALYVVKNKKIGEKIYMGYELDNMIGLEKLDLYYEVHLVGLDGECFIYTVYFDGEIKKEKFEEIKKSVEDFSEKYNNNGDTYAGYIDITQRENKIDIFLDLGNVLPQNENISIQGILKAINNVEGIRKVMINEF